MNRGFILSIMALFVLLLVAGDPAFAEFQWVDLENERENSQIRPGELSFRRTATGYDINLQVPGFVKDSATRGEEDFSIVAIPGASPLMVKGAPDLPKISAIIPVPTGARVKGLKINKVRRSIHEFQVPIQPSRGHISRSENPSDIPYERGEQYDGIWPPKIAKVESAFTFGAVSAIRIELMPFQYRGSDNNLLAHSNIDISLELDEARGSFIGNGPKTAEFLELYARFFREFPELQEEIKAIPQEGGTLLIITPEKFATTLAPLVEWKRKTGLVVNVKTIPSGISADQIKQIVQGEYDNGRLTHLMLIGDHDTMPLLRGKNEGAPSDACYVKLAGNDNIPDAFHCRLSANTVDELKVQINKILFYEKHPSLGADAAWMKKGTGIASSEGNPADFVRMGDLRDALLAFRYDEIDEIYDESYGGGYYDDDYDDFFWPWQDDGQMLPFYKKRQNSAHRVVATPQAVAAAVNSGRGLINYIGHGSETTWCSSDFSASDVKKLENAWQYPFIISVACVNGKLDHYTDCFAEAWAKAGTPDEPLGSIAILASTTNESWVPPCDMQKEIVNVQICGEKLYSLGALVMSGMLKAFEIWGAGDKSEGNMLNEQNILFGDSTVLFRNDLPVAVEVQVQKNGKDINFSVEDGVKYAQVCVYNRDMTTVISKSLNDSGKAMISVPKEDEYLYTLTGFNLLPVVDVEIP